MGEATYNPFRQVALALISLTIIVIGITYNQATEKSEAEVTSSTFGTKTQQTTPPAPSTKTTTPVPNTSTTTPSEIAPVTPKITPIVPVLDTINVDLGLNQFEINPTIDLGTALKNLTTSLDTIRQFAASPRELAFASDGLELGLPGIGLPSVVIVPEIAPAVTPTTTASPTTTTTNPPLPLWKLLTGYNQLERWADTLSTIQERNIGTGKCMIDITGIGCVVNW